MRVLAGLVLLAGTACLDIDSDPCADVACDDGEVCVALESGPLCTCDAYHEPVGDECVSIEEGEGEGEGDDE